VRLKGQKRAFETLNLGGKIMKTVILGVLALTMTAGAALANEPYLPRSEKSLQRLDANKDGRIERDEIRPRMAKRFAAIDANGDKVVTVAEIDTMLQKRLEARRTRMLALMDANKDGNITTGEFDRVADSMFDKADTDHNGGVDMAELKGFRRAEWRKAFLGQPAQ
jgi:Ca2+-binding EF-hand superfamily protein